MSCAQAAFEKIKTENNETNVFDAMNVTYAVDLDERCDEVIDHVRAVLPMAARLAAWTRPLARPLQYPYSATATTNPPRGIDPTGGGPIIVSIPRDPKAGGCLVVWRRSN